MKAIMNAALEKTIPIAWYEPERFPEKQELATCFVLRFPNRLVGVTAKHVYCAYLKQSAALRGMAESSSAN
jgi:hypothetical protein